MSNPAEPILIALRAADAGLREAVDASRGEDGASYTREAAATALDRLRIACVRYRVTQEFREIAAGKMEAARPIVSDHRVKTLLDSIAAQLDALSFISGGMKRAAVTVRAWAGERDPKYATSLEIQCETLARLCKKTRKDAA